MSLVIEHRKIIEAPSKQIAGEGGMSELRLRFLGGMSISLEEQALSDGLAAKALALLCYLALSSEAQTRNSLAGLFWSDFPEHRARGNLRDTLSMLRQTPLDPYVQTSRRFVAFNSNLPHWIDTAEFQKGVGQSIQDRPADPSGLETAIEQYRGEFLAGFHVQRAALFEEWVTFQRQQMHLQAIEALQRLVDFHLDADSCEAGIRHAHHLLTLDSWREESHRNLMLLLLLNGQFDEAVNQYKQCLQILDDELGVNPSQETQILYQNILKQIETTLPEDKMHIVALESPYPGPVPHNLPGQVTVFIGREDEQRTIDNYLTNPTNRLITILGVGGIGKTRLALAVGERQVRAIRRDGGFRFPDGVFFVPLLALYSPSELITALCQALGFQPSDEGRKGRSIKKQLLDYLRRKRLLLIVDNFEQLLDGAGILAEIHHIASEVRLLITSRQKLSLRAERQYPLRGMPYPNSTGQVINPEKLLADYSAAGLFTASARRVKPDFRLQEDEVSSLIQICHLVEGLPLAVELAAGWTNLLSVADIAAEIEHGLSFLESDLHDLPDRHRSMEAVFDVSWQRLTTAEKAMFSQLCVFRGGFTRQAAGIIADASLPQLATLVNKTLIQYDKKLDRYQIHRLLRQYVSDKLASDPAAEHEVRDRHCLFFNETLQLWDEQLKGAGQLEALGEFEDESANVRAAWYFALEVGQFERLDNMVDGLGRLYHWRRRFHEGETACSHAEESLFQSLTDRESNWQSDVRKRILAKIMTWHSIFSERAKAMVQIEQALGALEDLETAGVDTRRERAFAIRRAGDLVVDTNQDEKQRHYQGSLELYTVLGDPWGISSVLTDLGWVAAHSGEAEKARRLGEEALILRRSIGDQKGAADTLWLLGTLAIRAGLLEESSRMLGESLDIRKTMGDRITDIAAGPVDLGMTLTWIGRMEEADEVREEELALYEALGIKEKIAEAHVTVAFSKLHVGQYAEVQHHANVGLELCRKIGNHRLVGRAMWVLAMLSLFNEEFDQTESLLKDSMESFRKVEGVAEIGWAFGLYAEVARRQNRPAVSKEYIYKALRTASGLLGMITNLIALLPYVNFLADQGQDERALELRATLDKYPIAVMSPTAQKMYSTRLAEAAAALPPEVVAAAVARGRARDLSETASEILAELEEVIMD